MNDPYKELGVSPDASDEQIKTAYRELARKYHPDVYAGNPLSDLAEEKMRDINAAYDQIQQDRRQGGSRRTGGYSQQGQAGSYSGSPSRFADIRRMINGGRVTEAEELLDGIPTSQRDAEWSFLKGSVCYSRGWLDQATSYFTAACNQDQGNPEYRAALNQMMWQQQTGYSRSGSTRMAGTSCDCCDMCAAVYCTNCLCNCCCGR